jgi:hypothetical protein
VDQQKFAEELRRATESRSEMTDAGHSCARSDQLFGIRCRLLDIDT